jgi:hypothetical protein
MRVPRVTQRPIGASQFPGPLPHRLAHYNVRDIASESGAARLSCSPLKVRILRRIS